LRVLTNQDKNAIKIRALKVAEKIKDILPYYMTFFIHFWPEGSRKKSKIHGVFTGRSIDPEITDRLEEFYEAASKLKSKKLKSF